MANEMQEKGKAGIFALIFSFLFPVIGVIIYFVQRDKVVDSVKYLYAAGAGFVASLVLGMLG
jgi:hypothetical protein